MPIRTPPPKLEWRPSFFSTGIGRAEVWAARLGASQPTLQRVQSVRTLQLRLQSKQEPPPTDLRHVGSSSRLPSRHRTRPSRPLATGDRHLSTNIVPLPLPAIASPASSPTTIPQFVLFARPDQHPPPTRPCRMNNRLDPVVDIPRRSLGSAVRRNQRNDGQDERAVGFGTQKASHRS